MNMPKYLKIIDAEYLEKYRIKLRFDDGKEVVVDFYPFLSQSYHPDIRKYLDTEMFKQFTITYGDLEWNDYELTFPIADLYLDQIVHQEKDASAA